MKKRGKSKPRPKPPMKINIPKISLPGFNLAYLYLAIVIILWASSPAVAKLLLNTMSGFQMLFYITLFASLSLVASLIISKKYRLAREFEIRDYVNMAIMGMLGVFIYYACLYGSFALMPVQQASIINYLWPLAIILFSAIVNDERISKYGFLAMALAFIGACIVITKGSLSFESINLLGFFLALFAAASFGLFSTLGKRMAYDKVLMMAFGYAFSFILSAMAMFTFSFFLVPSFSELLGLVWIGMAVNAFAYILWLSALESGKASKASTIIYLTPFLALVFINFLTGEAIEITSIIGLVLIVAGIVFQISKDD